MVLGPIERFQLRIEQLEGALGRRSAGKRGRGERRSRREGKLGPGGRWLLERLGTTHAEALDKDEQDALGEALAAEQRGDYRTAQQWLDLLWRSHQLRMEVIAGNCGAAKVAEKGTWDGATD